MGSLSLLPSAPFFPTASELRRAAECVAPWALGLPESEDAPSVWAEHGRYQHSVGEDLVNESQHVPDLGLCSVAIAHLLKEAIDADRRAAKCIEWPDRIRVTVRAEVGIKWRPGVLEDEAALCERKPRERLRGWFSGTADLAYVRTDGVLVVADWKFGPREHVTGEPAKDSCQGFFLALAFCAALGITGSSDAVVVARFERRMVSENGIEVDAHDITWGELCRWRDTLAGLAGRITSAVGAAPKLSAACGHCKAKTNCPSWMQLENVCLASVWSPDSGFSPLERVPQTDDDARVIHHAIDAGSRLVDTWKEWEKSYVLTHPEGVIVGLGLKLKAIPSKDREVLDTPEALDAIEAIVPGGVVFERKAGIGTITKAVGDGVTKANEAIVSPSKKRQTKVAEVDRVFGELVAAGAVIDRGKKLTVRTVRSDEKEW